jgi:general secretion pathway protein G
LSLIVLVFILVTVLVGIPLMGPHVVSGETAKLKTAITQLRAFRTAIEMFKDDNGFYPVGPSGLNDLVVKPAAASTNWHQYLDKVYLDPWGHSYDYECPGKHNTNSYDLSSAGPDGKFGMRMTLPTGNRPDIGFLSRRP